jgi:DNA polymerase-1
MKDSILYQKEVERRNNKNNQTSRAKQSPEITASPFSKGGRGILGLYKTISSIEELPPYDTIALDTETTGLERDATGGFVTADNHQLLGVSLCGEASKAYWLPADKIVPFVVEATLEGKQLIMHNAKFDLQVLKRNDIDLYGNPIFDTMIAHQLLDENERHGLKHLATTILGAEVQMEQNPMIESPLLSSDASQLVEYACADADDHKTKSLVNVVNTFQLYLSLHSAVNFRYL